MSNEDGLFRPKEYFKPTSIDETAKLLAKYGEKGAIIAGGTDVLATKNPRTEVLIDIAELGLNYIISDEQGMRIGATTTLSDIETSPNLKGNPFYIITQAAHKVGTPLIRNLGTIGGNLCNASPSADTPPPFLALGARLVLVSVGQSREIPLDEFFAGPFRSIKEPGELLTEIVIPPLSPRTGTSYQYLTKISSVDESLVAVAVCIVMDGKGSIIADARIGLISVAPTPMRARKTEEMLLGKEASDALLEKAAKLVAEEIRPRSRADYRRDMSAVLAERTIREAVVHAKGHAK